MRRKNNNFDKYKKTNKPKGRGPSKSVKGFEKVKATCIGISEEGKGLIRYKEDLVGVPHLMTGEEALIEISSNGKFHNAKLISVIKKSEDRIKPKCKYYYDCGGCQLQHMTDEAQAKHKEEMVRRLMKPFGKVDEIISMKTPYEYRNKIHSAFTTVGKGEVTSGIYKENTHSVIPVENCIIQDKRADEILKTIRKMANVYRLKVYNEKTRNGFLRHVLIRTGFTSNQIMVVFVVTDKVFPAKSKFIKELITKHPEINTVLMNINRRATSIVLGEEEKVLYGKGAIQDTLCGLTFKISAKSFYQINPVQTEKLYNKAVEYANLKGDETVIDAYSGIGTISLIASKNAKEVIGVELNKDAVKNAITNAKINNIRNARFYQGDAGEFMVGVAKERGTIDTVFMDPPRSGSDDKFLSSVVKLSPKQIIYISCNPVTQVRDLKYLTKKGYRVEKIQPVDMFPQTFHVETVVKLVKSKSKKRY